MENTIRTNAQLDTNSELKVKKNSVSTPIKLGNNNEADKLELSTQLKNAKKQNGLIEKVADKIKSTLNIGYNSKKLEETVKKAESNEITKEEAQKEIENYRASQENVAQAVGDVASSAGAITAFFTTKQGIEKLTAQHLKINNNKESVSKIIDTILSKNKSLADYVKKHMDKRHTAIIAGTLGAVYAGSLIKSLSLKINRIGTQQYKPEINKETMTKEEIKKVKKEAKKQKASANRRNALTGAINGLMTPIISVLGVIGAPLYVLGNSLSRYFIGSKEDKGNKSLKGYVNNLKNSPITHITSAAAIAIPAIQQGKFNKIFEKNIDKAVDNIKSATLEKISTGKSSYSQLEEIMFENSAIKNIMNNDNLQVSEQIQKLSDENIFAVKFKQINSNSDELARALKTECPATRTLDEAQELITKTFGDKYKVKKCVGVGTVAESYIVESNGKEYCIKMLKDGITADKIAKDKEKFIKMVQNLEGKTEQEKTFLIKNIENIADGVMQEVDLTNEMKAAEELAKVTQKAKLVKPVMVKNNIYVMEKADGITLSDFSEYTSSSWRFKNYKTNKIKERSEYTDAIKEAKETIENYKTKLADERYKGFEKTLTDSLEYYEKRVIELESELKKYDKYIELEKLGLGNLSEKETERMLSAYQDILVEQFSKVNKEGKIIHGDIHPGNIFIDVPALKAGKKDFFTLIDTGNTIKQSQQTAMRFLNLSNYINNADYENIAEFVLDGATLPEGLTKGKAKEQIIEELKNAFFDNKTYTGAVSNDNILSITDGIMQKLNIIPADTQGNLMKSKTSATQSMEEFINAFINTLGKRLDGVEDEKEAMKKLPGMIAKAGKNLGQYPIKQNLQERKNLALLTPKEKIKLKKSKSTPAKNSLEYLTYIIKQHKDLPAGEGIIDGLAS
ncbi:hypothetical protein IJC60_00290 [bacterium]|nr:hypothetical protein [bacterium]